jgi:hypothetical protein
VGLCGCRLRERTDAVTRARVDGQGAGVPAVGIDPRKGYSVSTLETKTNGRTTLAPVAEHVSLEPVHRELETPKGEGWLVFSAIALGFAGVWGLIEGILAISSSKVFTENATYVFSGLNTWGWIVTILGGLTLIAAFAVVTRSQLARWFGIAVAALYAYGQLMFLHANPWWSMAMLAVSGLVIYGLSVHGGRTARTD